MTTENTLSDRLFKLAEENPAYRKEAYMLVFETIEYAHIQQKTKGHLTGGELVRAMLEYAQEEYGPMAEEVINYFGIKSPQDMGRIVYLLIGANLLFASENDSPEDFNVIDKWFEAAEVDKNSDFDLPKID